MLQATIPVWRAYMSVNRPLKSYTAALAMSLADHILKSRDGELKKANIGSARAATIVVSTSIDWLIHLLQPW